MGRGRPPLGAKHVERLDGTSSAKQRLATILRTLSGELTVEEACSELDISPAHFHRLREETLQQALASLEPGKPGRPAEEPDAGVDRVRELEDQVRELSVELRASQIREEIAILMPHLRTPSPVGSKKKSRRRRRR